MPGLVGFTHPDRYATPSLILQEMQTTITRQTPHGRFSQPLDELFIDPQVCATRSRGTVLQPQSQPLQQGECYLWFDGEFYNSEALVKTYGVENGSDLDLFLVLYRQCPDLTFLRQINGIYSAVLYDKAAQRLYLISDRYGLRPLCWSRVGRSLVWASESKAFLELPGFQTEIDPAAIEDFLGLRYFIGDRTWFKGVELLPAATILTWDLQAESLQQRRYWGWDEIAPLTAEKFDPAEIADELGRLFINAVKQQTLTSDRVGLTLSGGLDSRAILAAMPDPGYPIQSVTYGKRGCEDVQIAAQVAKVKASDHHIIELSSDNWLDERIQNIWVTDGTCSLMHMQYLSALNAIRNQDLFDVVLHGTGGGGFLKGIHLFQPDQVDDYVLKNLNLRNFSRSESHKQSVLSRFRDYFAQLNYSSHILCIDSRIRSFLFKDSRLSFSYGIDCRLPFLDNELQEFLYAVPESLKTQHQIYDLMLLRQFPKFYQRIPRQGLGEPISPPGLIRRTKKFYQRLQNKLQREGILSQPAAVPPPAARELHDYGAWAKQEPARPFFQSVLDNPQALYPEFIDRDQTKQDWQNYLDGKDNNFDRIGQIFTFEIWLQQVFSKKYRPVGSTPVDSLQIR